MTTNSKSGGSSSSGSKQSESASKQNEGGTTLADRAGDLKDRAGGLLQDGLDYVKNNPGKTAAVIGGVAAAASAYVNKDKLAETASGLKDKVSTGKGSDEKA